MTLEKFKEAVWAANIELSRRGLAILTWGNASGIDRERGLVAIKPSGLPYEGMKPEDMVIVDLAGTVVSGSWRPSSDLPTHLALYLAFPACGGVVHTHSTHATAFAQAGADIPAEGTTHADYFYAPFPAPAP
jgi:L-ribulose-5-phosphate 4-epimerase